MSIIGSTDLADGMQCGLVNHDPTSVATDLLKGSLIIDANGKVYRKMDDGPTTNVCDVAEHKCNDTATGPPTVDDDDDLGYSVGSFWHDVAADKAYTCLDATDGAAVWIEITGAGTGDTLPVVDTTPVVKGSGDASKLVRIEADGLTTDTTRVLTMPDADITPDDASAPRTPSSHASSHENDGGDEIGVGGLSGALADPQTPTTHASAHQDGGGDEISVVGLSGLLGDTQTPTAHDLAGDKHSSDTLADLNAKVSDADLVALAGQIGGTAASPDVRGVRETGGPTSLTLGAIADGEYARRSGGALVGDTPAGGGDVTAAAALGDDKIIRGDGGVKGVQETGMTVDDSDNITGAGTINAVTVEAHASRHQDGGDDEISVAALSGELADPQPPKAHKADHVSGGGDAFAVTDVLEAIIKRLQTTTGPTTLLIGAVADGEYLRRSGTALIGATPSGGGGESYVDRGDPSAADYSIGSGLTADGAWNTLDLSSIVPVEAASKRVHLRCRIIDNTVEAMMQIRKLGNINDINAAKGVIVNGNDSFWFDAWAVMDSLRRVEYNIDSGMATAEITVAGWFV